MLKFIFTDIYDNEIELNSILALSINKEENVPADDMTAVFAYQDLNELVSVKMYDNDEIEFTGIVDEQQKIVTGGGMYLKIIARSMAGALLDNESVPVTYNHPSTSLIFERHVKPFGIKSYNGNNSTYFGELVISKGMSNFQALSNFCNNCFSTTPRINSKGEVDINGLSYDKSVTFSPKESEGGIEYISMTESIKRCEEVSAVNVKVTNSSGYLNVVKNDDAQKRKIKRERYLNAVLTDTPMKCADIMIKNGKQNSYYVKLVCPFRHLDILGNKAIVKSASSDSSKIENLYVSSVRYTLNHSTDSTTVILKRRDV